MRKILIPIDHSNISETLVDFAAGLNDDFLVEEIVLLKPVNIGTVARILPSPDMLLMTDEEVETTRSLALDRAEGLLERLRAKLTRPVKLRLMVPEGNINAILESAIIDEQPELLLIGNDPEHLDPEDTASDAVISIAKLSSVPVLLVPARVIYRRPERLLIPTSFKNLDRLQTFDRFFRSQLWQSVQINVFHVVAGKDEEAYEDNLETISSYFRGMRFKIQFKTCTGDKVPDAILQCAEENDIDMIFALPGKHGFFHQLLHRSVTADFALRSTRPVFLLK